MKQTLTEIVDLITTFDNTTQEAEHTDSGGAWTLLNEIRDTADRALGRQEHCATWGIFDADWEAPEGWYHIQRDDSEDLYEDDEEAAKAHFVEVTWYNFNQYEKSPDGPFGMSDAWRVIARYPKTDEAKKAVSDWDRSAAQQVIHDNGFAFCQIIEGIWNRADICAKLDVRRLAEHMDIPVSDLDTLTDAAIRVADDSCIGLADTRPSLLTTADRAHIENTDGIVVCDAGRMNTDEETGERWASCWVRMPKAEPSAEWRCGSCGGTNVERLAWTDANTQRITTSEGPFESMNDNYCNDCGDNCDLVGVSEERCAECGEEREDDAHTCSRTRWNTENNSNE